MTTFRKWLLAQTNEDTPTGDVARDMQADIDMGCLKTAKTARGMKSHMLRAHRPSESAITAFDDARAEYERLNP